MRTLLTALLYPWTICLHCAIAYTKFVPSIAIRTHLLSFLICAFQSLDNGLVRKECAPLVSISIWNHLDGDQARDTKFAEHQQLRKVWRASHRRYDAADETLKAKLDFERGWLYSMICNFVNVLYTTGVLREGGSSILRKSIATNYRQNSLYTVKDFLSFLPILKVSFQQGDMLMP